MPRCKLPPCGPDPLLDRILFITGAAGRLGGIAARGCASAGGTVILCDKDTKGLERAYDEILALGGPKPAICPLDFTHAAENDYRELAATVEAEFGRLDGLLHTAAAFAPLGPVAHISVQEWSSVFHVNVNAPFVLTRELLSLLNKSENGSILFQSDSSARQARAYWGGYAVSKLAMEGFANILADEMEASGRVRVNILLPGPVDSPIRKKAFPAEDPRKIIAAEQLEKLYIYLLGDSSRGLNRQVFNAEEYLE